MPQKRKWLFKHRHNIVPDKTITQHGGMHLNAARTQHGLLEGVLRHDDDGLDPDTRLRVLVLTTERFWDYPSARIL